jgi:hypothetical protein
MSTAKARAAAGTISANTDATDAPPELTDGIDRGLGVDPTGRAPAAQSGRIATSTSKAS